MQEENEKEKEDERMNEQRMNIMRELGINKQNWVICSHLFVLSFFVSVL